MDLEQFIIKITLNNLEIMKMEKNKDNLHIFIIQINHKKDSIETIKD